MKILFMGTPDIAAGCLARLCNEGYDVAGVVCQPDKPKGRGHKMLPPEAKVEAQNRGIPVYQPESLKNGELMPVLEEIQPQVIIVVAYGKILPKYVLDFPKYGCINMHASKLPKYRGAAPIQWAVINGDEETAAAAMLMDEGLDTGDILAEHILKIGEYETAEELFHRMTAEGGEVLCEVLKNIENLEPRPQRGEASYAPMIKKEMAHIDWNERADKISKLICGMNSWPLAYTYYKEEAVKVIAAEKRGDCSGECGEIISADSEGILVKAKVGSILIKSFRFPGKRTMSVEEYLKGNTIEVGEILK